MAESEQEPLKEVDLEWLHDALLADIRIDREARCITFTMDAGSAGTLKIGDFCASRVAIEAINVESAVAMVKPPLTDHKPDVFSASIDFCAWAAGVVDDAVDIMSAWCERQSGKCNVTFKFIGITNDHVACEVVAGTVRAILNSDGAEHILSIV